MLIWLQTFGINLWTVLCELSPWFLFGALVAGLLHGLTPTGFVRRRLNGYWGVLISVIVGIPLPLCSCAVIPTGIGLKRSGASDGASIGFLISTPQTGIDSVFVTAAFLGWPFAIYKVVVALILGTTAGFVIERFSGRSTKQVSTQDLNVAQAEAAHDEIELKVASCCSADPITQVSPGPHELSPENKTTEFSSAADCCSTEDTQSPTQVDAPIVAQIKSASCKPKMRALNVIQPEPQATNDLRSQSASANPVVAYLSTSFRQSLEIIRSIYLWVILGVVVSALISTMLPVGSIDQWVGKSDWFQSPIALLISIPLYVCATASVPIAAALVGSGLSVGASIVFLMAGPATNVATIGAIYRTFSRLAFWTYLSTVIIGSIAAAFVFDHFFNTNALSAPIDQHLHLDRFSQLSAVVLICLFLWFYLSKKSKH